MYRTRKCIPILTATLLIVAASDRGVAAEPGLSEADRAFMSKAAQGGLMEVAAGKLAVHRALDPAVRKFAQTMIHDHTAANEKLKSLAGSIQVLLPGSMSQEQQATLGKLETLVGADFDKTFAQTMVNDHMEDIVEFEKEVKKGQDTAVKDFAASLLPTLRHHLMMANQISSGAKKDR